MPQEPTEPELNTSNPDKITYQENQLQFTIWGGIEKDNIHRLKINLLVQLKGDDFRYYQDDVNLYSNGQLQRYIKGAAEELETSTTILKNTIRILKSRIEEYRLKANRTGTKSIKAQNLPNDKGRRKQGNEVLKNQRACKKHFEIH